MSTVTSKEARYHFSEILDRAERGDVVKITRRGGVVAQLVSPNKSKKRRLPDLEAFRKKINIKGESLSKIIVNQRREERF